MKLQTYKQAKAKKLKTVQTNEIPKNHPPSRTEITSPPLINP